MASADRIGVTAEELREFRQSLGWSQRRLAGELYLDARGAETIHEWEAGRKDVTGPATRAMEAIASGHGIVPPWRK